MNLAQKLVEGDVTAVITKQNVKLDALRGKHIFISGGTGFLGTWLLEIIKELNSTYDFKIRVTVFSRKAKDFARKHTQFDNLDYITYINGDIRYLSELPLDTEYIIHAASVSDRRLAASTPNAVADTIGLGTMQILRASNLLENLNKFILLSSCLIYGKQTWDLDSIDEEYTGSISCDQVGNVYAESKRFSEILAQSYLNEYKLPLVILRPFAFIGPHLSLQLPWAGTDFIRDSLLGGPIRIMGDGSTIRSFMYASDYAFWVLAALANGASRKKYNVGNPESIKLIDFAELIVSQFTPKRAILTNIGQKNQSKSKLVPNVDNAINDLRVSVTVPLTEAIERTIYWHKESLK